MQASSLSHLCRLLIQAVAEEMKKTGESRMLSLRFTDTVSLNSSYNALPEQVHLSTCSACRFDPRFGISTRAIPGVARGTGCGAE